MHSKAKCGRAGHLGDCAGPGQARTRRRLSFAQLLAVMSTKIKSKMLSQNGHFPFVSNALNNTQLGSG